MARGRRRALGILWLWHALGLRDRRDTANRTIISSSIARTPPDRPIPSRSIFPTTGSDLSTALANVAAMHAAFDYQAVANSFYIETAPERYEVSVILAPGYQPQAGDGTAANRVQFRKSALDASNATATTRAKYRFYIADECGDGHWSLADGQWLTTPIDFSSVFQLPNGNPDNLPTYVRRYRPGRNTLFSKDLNNKPLQAQLAVSRNYTGADAPCVWDTVSGTWQQIDGGWSLMEDRLGIEVTVDDPEAWNIGKPPAGTTAQEPTGVLHGITSISESLDDDSVGEDVLAPAHDRHRSRLRHRGDRPAARCVAAVVHDPSPRRCPRSFSLRRRRRQLGIQPIATAPTRSCKTTPTPRWHTLASFVPRMSFRRSRPRSRSRCWLITFRSATEFHRSTAAMYHFS